MTNRSGHEVDNGLSRRGVTFRGAGARFRSFDFAIARRRGRDERIQQFVRRLGHLFNRAIERFLVGFRRLGEPAELPDKLQRRRMDLFISRGRFEVVQRFDIST